MAGVVMAFLGDHHWLTSYERAVWFSERAWLAILIGTVLLLVGCYGLSFKMPGRTAILVGLGLIALILTVLSSLENPYEIVNVHSSKIAFLLPVFAGVCGSVVLIVVGSLRLILQRCRRQRAWNLEQSAEPRSRRPRESARQ